MDHRLHLTDRVHLDLQDNGIDLEVVNEIGIGEIVVQQNGIIGIAGVIEAAIIIVTITGTGSVTGKEIGIEIGIGLPYHELEDARFQQNETTSNRQIPVDEASVMSHNLLSSQWPSERGSKVFHQLNPGLLMTMTSFPIGFDNLQTEVVRKLVLRRLLTTVQKVQQNL